jgi:hypothetical protein
MHRTQSTPFRISPQVASQSCGSNTFHHIVRGSILGPLTACNAARRYRIVSLTPSKPFGLFQHFPARLFTASMPLSTLTLVPESPRAFATPAVFLLPLRPPFCLRYRRLPVLLTASAHGLSSSAFGTSQLQ